MGNLTISCIGCGKKIDILFTAKDSLEGIRCHECTIQLLNMANPLGIIQIKAGVGNFKPIPTES